MRGGISKERASDEHKKDTGNGDVPLYPQAQAWSLHYNRQGSP